MGKVGDTSTWFLNNLVFRLCWAAYPSDWTLNPLANCNFAAPDTIDIIIYLRTHWWPLDDHSPLWQTSVSFPRIRVYSGSQRVVRVVPSKGEMPDDETLQTPWSQFKNTFPFFTAAPHSQDLKHLKISSW